MLDVAQRYLRRQFYLYWPRMSRLARITAYFAGLNVLLLLIWSASLPVKPGGSASLSGWVKFLAYVTAFLALALGLRWLRRKLMWRLRNRLVVTYVFIGVIPSQVGGIVTVMREAPGRNPVPRVTGTSRRS